MKVVFCTLFLERPHPAFIRALEASLPLIEAAGWEHSYVQEVGCPYISEARSKILRKALDRKPDVIVFLDYDVSWAPESLLKLISTDGDVVAGTYRFKDDEERYMGELDVDNMHVMRTDGCLMARKVPAGFLKLTREALSKFAKAYPELLYGDPLSPHLDLFNHGAIDGLWYGEDYAFSKRWIEKCGMLWVVPDIDVHHNSATVCYEGNLHKHLINYKEERVNES